MTGNKPPVDPEMEAMLNVLKGVYADQAAEYGMAEVRAEDGSLATSTWNAVILGHPNRFEDMPETIAFARGLAARLIANGHIRAEAAAHAPAMLAAFMRFLWDTQNLMYLDPQFAAGQAGALQALVADIDQHWAPPDEAWFSQLRGFPGDVDAALALIEAQTYETVYDVLRPGIADLSRRGSEMLASVEREHPAALAGASAYVCGALIDRNTFSPLDGSVPEDIGQALADAYHELDRDNQGRYMPYLGHGFEAARNSDDELDRWRIEDT